MKSANSRVEEIMPVQRATQKQRRIANRLKSALVEFIRAAKAAGATNAQRDAVTRALLAAKQLPDDLYSDAINKALARADEVID